MKTYSEKDLYSIAKMLKSEDDENPEYDRALTEMISYLTGDVVDRVSERLKAAATPEQVEGLEKLSTAPATYRRVPVVTSTC